MQVTFNTDSPADVEFVRKLLGIAAPPAPTPAGSTQELPLGAPAGAYWVKSVGVPSLHDKDGNVLAVDWTATPPRVVPPPPRTPDGNGMKGEDFLNIVRGETP